MIQPLPFMFTLAIASGVLFHDMHLDRATTVAIALPALIASAGAIDKIINQNAHTHVERAEMPNRANPVRSALPKIQPRDNDRVHIQNKKLYVGGGNDLNYIWPSV